MDTNEHLFVHESAFTSSGVSRKRRHAVGATAAMLLWAIASSASAQNVSLSQSSGPGGITITATSSGFDEPYNTGFSVDGGSLKACPSDARANCQVTLTMPGETGPHTIRAFNSIQQSDEETFNAIRPTFRVDPTCGEQGLTMTVTGQNFPVGFDVSIWIDTTDTNSHQFPDTSGNISIPVALPLLAAGPHTVHARNSVRVDETEEFDAGSCEVIGTVTEVEGTFEVLQADGIWRPLHVGDQLVQNAVVRTLGNSRGKILFLDNTQFHLSENTRIELDRHVYDPNDHSGHSDSSWLVGGLRYVSGLLAKDPNEDNLRIDTTHFTLGIRGTEFIGKLDAVLNQAELYLIEGTLAITPIDEGITHVYPAPQTIFVNRTGIVSTAALTQEEYDAIENELFPPPVTDTTAPVTTAQLTPSSPDGTNSWYRSPVGVALSATDGESGVASTTYELDGGGPTTYAGAFPVNTDGNHSVAFRSQDNADNIEVDQSVSFKIDATPPTDLAFVGAIQDGDTFAEGSVPASPTCEASDGTSGLLSCAVTGYGTAPGSHTLTATATDNAGNTNTLQIAYAVTPTVVTAPKPIGYWKSNPTQAAALLPQPLGGYSVNTSARAAAVFKAATSKNAYDMLAAQLLAAELNRANGVPATCVSTTITDANGLLSAAGYNGPNTTTPPAKAQKTAVTTATMRLDSFNNVGCQ